MDDHSHDSTWFCGFCYYQFEVDGEFTIFPSSGSSVCKVIMLSSALLAVLLLLYPALVPEQLRER